MIRYLLHVLGGLLAAVLLSASGSVAAPRTVPGPGAVAAKAAMAPTGTVVASETGDFSRYQIILDRAPFGAMPGVQPEPGVQPSFAQGWNLVGLVQSNGDNGPYVAILEDKGTHKIYTKAEGETLGDPADPFKVTRIVSNSPESVIVVKGLETGTLTFAKPSSAPAAPVPALAAPGPAAAVAPVPPPGPTMPVVVGQQQRRIPFRRGN